LIKRKTPWIGAFENLIPQKKILIPPGFKLASIF